MLTATFTRDLSRLSFLERVFPQRADNFSKKLAQKTESIVQSSWSPSSPSVPGSPPARVSGALSESVAVEHIGEGEWAVTVSAPHSGYLEDGTVFMEPRPYLLPAAEQAMNDLDRAGKAVFEIT